MNRFNWAMAGVAGAAVIAVGFLVYADNQRILAASETSSGKAESTDILHNAMDHEEQLMLNEVVKVAGKKNAEQLHTMLQRDANIVDSITEDYGDVSIGGNNKIYRPPYGKQLQKDYKTFELMFSKPINERVGKYNLAPRILRVHQLANQGAAQGTLNDDLSLIDSAYQSALVRAGVSPLPNSPKLDEWRHVNLNPAWNIPKDYPLEHVKLTPAQNMNELEISDVFRRFDRFWFGGRNPYEPKGTPRMGHDNSFPSSGS